MISFTAATRSSTTIAARPVPPLRTRSCEADQDGAPARFGLEFASVSVQPTRAIQRKCAACAEEDRLQRSSLGTDPVRDVDEAVDVAGRGGEALPTTLRAQFEPKFEHDFSKVRVHHGPDASAAARGIRARAYTLGHDIVFGAGHYAPSTLEGRRLLAHELTHVVQQGGAAPLGAPTLQRAATQASPSASDQELDRVIHAIEGRVGSAAASEGANPAATLEALRNVRASGTEAQKSAVLAKIHTAAEQQQAKVAAAGGVRVAEPDEPRREMQRKSAEVSGADDPFEREADRVAARVVDGATNAGPITPLTSATAQAKRIQRQAEAGTLILIESGPIGWIILGAIVVGVGIYAATRTCPPCPAPPGPDIDRVPPSTPHFPCPGDHWHYYVYNQNPVTCTCYGPRRMFGGCCGGPGAPC